MSTAARCPAVIPSRRRWICSARRSARRGPFVDWRNAVRIVRRRVWPAATVAVIVFVAAVVHAFTQVPVYEAKARILIEADRGNPAGLKDPLEEDRSTVTDYQTQLMILQSRSLARQTMQALGVWNRPIAMKPATPVERGSFQAFVAAAARRRAQRHVVAVGARGARPPAAARRERRRERRRDDEDQRLSRRPARLAGRPIPAWSTSTTRRPTRRSRRCTSMRS